MTDSAVIGLTADAVPGGSDEAGGWCGSYGPVWPDIGESPLRAWLELAPLGPGRPEPPAPGPSRSTLALSDRDVEVLRMLASGESTADISRELAYSESMIKHVIHGVVGRIGARNRVHAVAIAIRAGVI